MWVYSKLYKAASSVLLFSCRQIVMGQCNFSLNFPVYRGPRIHILSSQQKCYRVKIVHGQYHKLFQYRHNACIACNLKTVKYKLLFWYHWHHLLFLRKFTLKMQQLSDTCCVHKHDEHKTHLLVTVAFVAEFTLCRTKIVPAHWTKYWLNEGFSDFFFICWKN